MKHTKHLMYGEGLFILLLLSIALYISAYELKLLQTEIYVKNTITKEVDYEAFRTMQLGEDSLEQAELQATRLLEKYPKLQKVPYVDKAGCLTFSMMMYSYDLTDSNLVNDKTFHRGIIRLAKTPQFKELYAYYKAIFSDLEYFPIPNFSDHSADISYIDSWYLPRTYGGDRKHEGTDLMASNNQRGFFPVISITDGIVEKMGWLEQGGYRVGIRSACGGYFYYAHLDSYAPELEQGDTIIAGQLLGFMGDSGYGSEGTIGQFDVHLHMGIYVNAKNGEMSVNPYPILQMLQKKRTLYTKD